MRDVEVKLRWHCTVVGVDEAAVKIMRVALGVASVVRKPHDYALR